MQLDIFGTALLAMDRRKAQCYNSQDGFNIDATNIECLQIFRKLQLWERRVPSR